MSNIRDGGTIVIGVEEKENAFIPVGVPDATLKTYQIDAMRDQLASFCDPSPEFRVEFPLDSKGRKFVVIKIAPFQELPLLSRAEVQGYLRGNSIYFRNTDKRVQSAPISNSHDLRELIELAARKMLQHRTALGYHLESGINEVFDEDLRSFGPNGFLKVIQAAGYWTVECRPNSDQQVPNLATLKEKIQKAVVRINLPFPYYALRQSDEEGIRNGDQYIEGYATYPYLHEFWRMYKSGHFILERMLQEDAEARPPHAPPAKSSVYYLLSVIHFITGAVEFISRLVAGGLYQTGVHLRMVLHNVQGRTLFLDDLNRWPFLYNRITHANLLSLTGSFDAPSLQQDPTGLSRRMILELVDSFGYNPTVEQVEIIQESYLASR